MSYILLVEDNQDNADMVIRILNAAGYRVRHCIRGLESSRIARDETPSLILLDFNLPDVDGQAMILVLKRQMGNKIPIVALTARASDTDKALAKRFGCTGFIGKPFTSEELLDVIRNLIPEVKQ